MIETLDTVSCFGEAQLLGVDLFSAGDDAGNRAETHADPRRARVDEIRQIVGEHRRVELVGLSVDVDISAREPGREKGGAETRCGRKKFVDKAVLGAPQGQRVEPRGGEEI